MPAAMLAGRRQSGGTGRNGKSPPGWDPSRPLKENLEAARVHFARQAVEHYDGDKQLAALKLGISYTTLWRTLKEQEPGPP